MLWDIDQQTIITNVPHEQEFNIWLSRLEKKEIDDIRSEILFRISGNEIATAGWLPGNEWQEPFQYIFDKACRSDYDASAKCFGLFVWTTLMEHDDYWAFGRYNIRETPINSITYFKVTP